MDLYTGIKGYSRKYGNWLASYGLLFKLSKRHIFPSLLPSLSSYTSSIPISTSLVSPCQNLRIYIIFYVWLLSAIQEELPVTGYMQVAEEHLFRLNHALLFFCKHSSFEVWNANYMELWMSIWSENIYSEFWCILKCIMLLLPCESEPSLYVISGTKFIVAPPAIISL